MIVNKKPLLFETHVRMLELSPFRGQANRVGDYVDRYLNGQSTLLRHPILTFRRSLLEQTEIPQPPAIKSAHPLANVELDYAHSRARFNVACSKGIAVCAALGTVGAVLVSLTSTDPEIAQYLYVPKAVGALMLITVPLSFLKLSLSEFLDLCFSRFNLGVYNVAYEFGKRLGEEIASVSSLGVRRWVND